MVIPEVEVKKTETTARICFPDITNGMTIHSKHLPLPEQIISGILSRGEKGELAGGSKSFKTWTLIHQSLAIASGTPWWDFPASESNVIFLNLEIPPAFFEARVRMVANAMGIQVPKRFHVWHLRNCKLGKPDYWEAFLELLKETCQRIEHPFLVSDPIYKLLGGRNENSAGDVGELFSQLDDMVERTDGANFFGHHMSKGNQAGKEPMDRASGSGVFSRDPDSILTMTKHEKESAYTVDLILRNHPYISPFVVEMRHPLFVRNPHLDPVDLFKRSGAKRKYTISMLVEQLGEEEIPTPEFRDLVLEETEMAEDTFYELLKKAVAQNIIVRTAKTCRLNGELAT